VSHVNIAPTVLRHLGLPWDGMDGAPCPPRHEPHRPPRAELAQAFPRSSSHAAKQRMWTWNLSSPGLSLSRANWIELQFIIPHRQIAHRAGAPTPGPPQVHRPPGWEFPVRNYCPGFLAEDCFVRHPDVSEHATSKNLRARRACITGRNPVQMPGARRQVASTTKPVKLGSR